MITPARASIAGAVLAVAAACSSPTLVCGCVLPPPFATLFGTVSSGGAPVSGATVHAVVMPLGCDQAAGRSFPDPQMTPIQTSAAGAFEITANWGTDRGCVRLVATRAAGDSAFTELDSQTLRASAGAPPRLRMDVAFP